MNRVTLKNGMVYQKGQRIERKNIYICDGIIMEISDDVLEGSIIDCQDLLIAPNFKNEYENVSDNIIETGTFTVLYNNLVRTHKLTLERLLDYMSDEKIEVGNIANFTIINCLEEQNKALECANYDWKTFELNF